MNDEIIEQRKELKAYFDTAIARSELITSLLPDLNGLPIIFSHWDHWGELILHCIYINKDIDAIVKCFTDAGWTSTRSFNQETGYLSIYFKCDQLNLGMPVGLFVSPQSEGSACVLHQIGTKEVPIYETICKEAMNEEANRNAVA